MKNILVSKTFWLNMAIILFVISETNIPLIPIKYLLTLGAIANIIIRINFLEDINSMVAEKMINRRYNFLNTKIIPKSVKNPVFTNILK